MTSSVHEFDSSRQTRRRSSRTMIDCGSAAYSCLLMYFGTFLGLNHSTNWSSSPSDLIQRERGRSRVSSVTSSVRTNGRFGVKSTMRHWWLGISPCSFACKSRAKWVYESKAVSPSSRSPSRISGCICREGEALSRHVLQVVRAQGGSDRLDQRSIVDVEHGQQVCHGSTELAEVREAAPLLLRPRLAEFLLQLRRVGHGE